MSTGVTSNFVKFNKRQKELVDKYGIAVDMTALSLMAKIGELTADNGIERFSAAEQPMQWAPIHCGRMRIANPILPDSAYYLIREKKDVKKFVNRTGAMLRAFLWLSKFNVKDRPKMEKQKGENVSFSLISKGMLKRLQFEFTGNVGQALTFASDKKATTRFRSRRRIVESSMSKVKTLWKKLLLKKMIEAKKETLTNA